MPSPLSPDQFAGQRGVAPAAAIREAFDPDGYYPGWIEADADIAEEVRDEDEYSDFLEDVAANGVRNPVTLIGPDHPDIWRHRGPSGDPGLGNVIDGHHRLWAAAQAGVDVPWEKYS